MPGLNVLIVDDDEDDRQLLEEAFDETAQSVRVLFACDGPELFEKLKAIGGWQSRPLILLDLNMPGMDGLEVLSVLRSDPSHKQTPIVILSTSSTTSDIEQAYALGANTYLVKSKTFDGLVETARVLFTYWGQLAQIPSPGSAVSSKGARDLGC